MSISTFLIGFVIFAIAAIGLSLYLRQLSDKREKIWNALQEGAMCPDCKKENAIVCSVDDLSRTDGTACVVDQDLQRPTRVCRVCRYCKSSAVQFIGFSV